ncbi:MAG TPA: amidase, partial [Blastocatellia bacterium]|nr:amidase [Blastocatellia bacterium]
RGDSGRIIRLRITGSKRTVVVGKELEVRRALSRSHLYSSAFVVRREQGGEGFKLIGAGWGHGVGLCQIGAAMMAEAGYSYEQILSHYFSGSTLKTAY